jgi:hypothetical protein
VSLSIEAVLRYRRTRGLDLPRANETPTGHHNAAVLEEHRYSPERTFSMQHQSQSGMPCDDSAAHIESDSEDDGILPGGQQLGEDDSYTAPPLSLITGSDRNFSLRNMLGPTDPSRRPQEKTHGAGRSVEGDLISRGVLSMDMAFQLFSL